MQFLKNITTFNSSGEHRLNIGTNSGDEGFILLSKADGTDGYGD